MNSEKPALSIYSGIFLVSTATLLLQTNFTRIFSVSIWYHFAFLVISVALFGFGASGVVLSVKADLGQHRGAFAWMATLFAVTTNTAYLGSVYIPFSPFKIASEPTQLFYFVVFDLLLALPFFFAGLTVASLLRRWPASAGSLYAWDLVGAALGTLLLFATLPLVGAPGVIVISSALATTAAVLLAGAGRQRAMLVVFAALHFPLFAYPELIPDVRVDESKPLHMEVTKMGSKITFTGWNALSRIDVAEREGLDPMIYIDSAAMTFLAKHHTKSKRHLKDLSSIAYRMAPNPDIVIIGSGGGIDVQNALALSARSVTCVEINPIIISLVTKRFREHTGDVFFDPKVRLIQDEGRSFISRMEHNADVIQITLIDTWAAGVSGAYSLTENYLYTSEAFRTYLTRLTDRGFLSITRWSFEAPRVVSLARTALLEMGVTDPSLHILVFQRDHMTNVMVKRTPLTREDLEMAHTFGPATDAKLLHDPFAPSSHSFYGKFFKAKDPDKYLAGLKTDYSSVSDDSPFFFQMARWGNVNLEGIRKFQNKSFLEPLFLPVGQITLVVAFGVGLFLSVVLLGVCLLGGNVPRVERYTWFGYFLALGLAFIVVEVILIQRFTLFLGHPTYSVTVVLFTILLSSGLGSAWSGRRRFSARNIVALVAVLLPISLLLLTFAVPPITSALIGLPLAARLLVALMLIMPVAFLMGIPFPVGIRQAGTSAPALIPWAWAVNGCASVVGSVLAVLGAMACNFSAMLVVAALIYFAALTWLALRLRRSC